jgi:hypothetical protein
MILQRVGRLRNFFIARHIESIFIDSRRWAVEAAAIAAQPVGSAEEVAEKLIVPAKSLPQALKRGPFSRT